MLFWSWVLIGWISGKRCALGYAECFAGSGYQTGRQSLEHPVMTGVGGVRGHFDVEEDQTTLSPDCPKPCQRDATRPSLPRRAENLGSPGNVPDQELEGSRKVTERVTATLLTACGKGSARPLRHDTRRTAHDNPRTRPIPRRARRNPLPVAIPTRRTTRIPSRPTRSLPTIRRPEVDRTADPACGPLTRSLCQLAGPVEYV